MHNIHSLPLKAAYVVFIMLVAYLIVVWLLLLFSSLNKYKNGEFKPRNYKIFLGSSDARNSLLLFSASALLPALYLTKQFKFGYVDVARFGGNYVDFNTWNYNWILLVICLAVMTICARDIWKHTSIYGKDL
jgi:hypothetical protein